MCFAKKGMCTNQHKNKKIFSQKIRAHAFFSKTATTKCLFYMYITNFSPPQKLQVLSPLKSPVFEA